MKTERLTKKEQEMVSVLRDVLFVVEGLEERGIFIDYLRGSKFYDGSLSGGIQKAIAKAEGR